MTSDHHAKAVASDAPQLSRPQPILSSSVVAAWQAVAS